MELHFADYDWDVTDCGDRRVGPGPNLFHTENVRLTPDGLHLAIRQTHGHWTCAMANLRTRLNYGTYTFSVIGRLDELDRNVVLGLFLYRDDDHELDIECARWGVPDADGLHYSLQPASPATTAAFPLALHGTHTTHQIVWHPGQVTFVSWHGHYPRPPSADHVLGAWRYPQPYHKPSGEVAAVNLWLLGGQPPIDGQEVEVTIADFTYTPHR